MELSRYDLLLLVYAFDFKENLMQRLEAFLDANEDETQFTLIGKTQQAQLVFTGFVASGALEMEHRLAELEKHNQQISEHIAGLEVVLKDLQREQG